VINLHRVRGSSMTPNFYENDIVLSFRYFRSLKVNDVILINIPKIGTVIKRIKSINGKELSITGDNTEYSSEIYNKKYATNDVLGKVLFKF
jgi:signal peptidase I|tara:strand:+ start:1960 stop:2232 length:273 start_codon:yes stop_codon:yes gene_type:complete